jgi:predicted SprT family Zn-dependent metalloprotease
LKSTQESITDTLLHEIAHALVGEGHGHDYTWRRMAISIGCNGDRTCGDEAVSTAKPNYKIECPNEWCKWHVYRYRMKRRNFGAKCPKCGTEVDIYKLSYK